MPIMPDAKLIEKVPLGLTNFLGGPIVTSKKKQN
jgi:hypothetical protein